MSNEFINFDHLLFKIIDVKIFKQSFQEIMNYFMRYSKEIINASHTILSGIMP